MITVEPGAVGEVVEVLRKRRRVSKDVMIVAGRADVCVLLQGTIEEINSTVINYKRIQGINTTETLMEVEVDMGW